MYKAPLLIASSRPTERLMIPSEATNHDGDAPLHYAVMARDEAIARLLLDSGADVNAQHHQYGETPLHWVAMLGDESIARRLITSGASVNARDHYGYTPLHRAVTWNHLKYIAMLLYSFPEIELNAQDENSVTPSKYCQDQAAGSQTDRAPLKNTLKLIYRLVAL